jgi:serine phosphatase RsbU (regulator of sigma subunit)
LDAIASHTLDSCIVIHAAIQEAVVSFTDGAAASDDITVVVLEFQGSAAPTIY